MTVMRPPSPVQRHLDNDRFLAAMEPAVPPRVRRRDLSPAQQEECAALDRKMGWRNYVLPTVVIGGAVGAVSLFINVKLDASQGHELPLRDIGTLALCGAAGALITGGVITLEWMAYREIAAAYNQKCMEDNPALQQSASDTLGPHTTRFAAALLKPIAIPAIGDADLAALKSTGMPDLSLKYAAKCILGLEPANPAVDAGEASGGFVGLLMQAAARGVAMP